jgi:glutaredoxin-dependent peroxiredoxin
MKGVSKRAAFVVDGHGKIAYAEVLEDAGKLPDLAAVRATVARLG